MYLFTLNPIKTRFVYNKTRVELNREDFSTEYNFEKMFQIDSECFKRYFKPKMLISKKSPLKFSFWNSTIFDENDQNVKIFIKNKKIKKIFWGIDLECFKT